jgi:hypothetical protein
MRKLKRPGWNGAKIGVKDAESAAKIGAKDARTGAKIAAKGALIAVKTGAPAAARPAQGSANVRWAYGYT